MPETNPRPNPRRRKVPKWKRFLRRYSPTILLMVLVMLSVTMIIVTVTGISAILNSTNTTTPQLQAPTTVTDPTLSISQAKVKEALSEAEKLAAGYDYKGAIALLEGLENFDTISEVTNTIDKYKEADKKLVSYTDLDNITHLFFHSLIAEPERAFDGDREQDGFNLYMVTVKEFKAILQSMHDRGFVLVSPYDIAYEVVDDNGARFVYGDIRLPEGKTPFLMSQDDVNYYGYMIGSGSGVDETPIFASSDGDGFASRLVIGEDGYPTCEYMDINGNITYGDYDLVPVLERFIQEHPDFSYHGARAILGVTGYEGVFGYRTKPSYETALGTERYQKEVEDAKKVAQCLKDHGWILASHSYGHPAYGNLTPERVEADSTKWEDTVQYIVGETDIILFPHGSDIGSFRNYAPDNEKFKILYEDGYRYFFNVDSKIAWTQVGTNYFRGSRRNIDGYRMYHHPEKLEDLFDVSKVFDPIRPTPVPPLSGGM